MPPSTTERSHILFELMDCVDEFVLFLDSGLKVLEANRGASVFLGYPMDELLLKKLPALLDVDERERIKKLIQTAQERCEDTTIFLTRSNREIPVRFSLSPMPGTGGKPRRYLLVARSAGDGAFIPDADASHDLAVRMLKGFADPLFIVDGPSRTVRDCNRAALAAFGFPRDEIIGQRLLSHVKSAEEHRWRISLEARAYTTYATAGIFQERIRFPRKDAPPLPCDLTGIPFFKPDGSLDSIIAMLFDRSAEEEREAELADLIGQVNDLAAELTATAAGYATRAKRERLSELGFTSRQIEIARLVASDASSKEIGFKLGIAESTVKNHLAVMYRKLGANSRIGFMRAISMKRIKIE